MDASSLLKSARDHLINAAEHMARTVALADRTQDLTDLQAAQAAKETYAEALESYDGVIMLCINMNIHTLTEPLIKKLNKEVSKP